ncbi:hypothetical protein GF337_01930 [candidate division KSB1 bacterium]|nr:hypothetical protein [candidate division KSB1 bacterium]
MDLTGAQQLTVLCAYQFADLFMERESIPTREVLSIDFIATTQNQLKIAKLKLIFVRRFLY